ncbi:MAG: hypothetical protein K2O32_15200 [Acetatifactor sp.]|nr:hypothetical protein [Acetatifactor sp.]
MPQKTNVCGVISLTFSILSVCIACCFGAGLIFAIPAFILGVIGVTRKNMLTGTAIAGIILSIIGFILSILTILLWGMEGGIAYGILEGLSQYE